MNIFYREMEWNDKNESSLKMKRKILFEILTFYFEVNVFYNG